jgi:nicotinamidase-related amidase
MRSPFPDARVRLSSRSSPVLGERGFLGDTGNIVAPDLVALVAPGHTALLTVELQRGVVGERSMLGQLAAAVAVGGVLERVAALCRAARAVGIPVLHCTAESRPDGLGGNRNARLFALARRSGSPSPDSDIFAVHSAVGVEPTDFVLPRLHGLSPMAGTSLDAILRNLGVTTVVATGVSVNVALLGLAFDAVNLGYQLVLARNATAGVGDEYVDAVYANTLSLLATVTTAEAVVDAWTGVGTTA